MVGDRYRIHPDQRLPALSAPGVVGAFSAPDERGSPKWLFALVCRRDVAPRTDVLNQFARFTRLPLVTPLRWGVVYWPPEKARRSVIILHQTGGERILPAPDSTIGPWREARAVTPAMNPPMPVSQAPGRRTRKPTSNTANN